MRSYIGILIFSLLTLLMCTSVVFSQTCPLKSRGDANCDNKVDIIDFSIFRTEFLAFVEGRLRIQDAKSNFDNDNVIGIKDFAIFRNGFLDQNNNNPAPPTTPISNCTPSTPNGLSGNGTTDNTAVIQTHLNSGKGVLLPEGTFRTSAPIVLKSNTCIVGQGMTKSIIKPIGNFHAMTANGLNNITLKGFMIDGNQHIGDHLRAILITETSQITVEQIHLHANPSGLYIEKSSNVSVKGMKATEMTAHEPGVGHRTNCFGLQFNTCTNCTVESSSFAAGARGRHQFGHAIRVVRSNGAKVLNNSVDTWGHAELAGGGGISAEHSDDVLISGNTVIKGGDGGLWLAYGADRAIVRGNRLEADGPVGPAIEINGSTGSLFENNIFANSARALWFNDIESLPNMNHIIRKNTFKGTRKFQIINLNANGIAGREMSNITIEDNIFEGPAEYSAIWIQKTKGGHIIRRNTFTSASDKAIYFDGINGFDNNGTIIENNVINNIDNGVVFGGAINSNVKLISNTYNSVKSPITIWNSQTPGLVRDR